MLGYESLQRVQISIDTDGNHLEAVIVVLADW